MVDAPYHMYVCRLSCPWYSNMILSQMLNCWIVNWFSSVGWGLQWKACPCWFISGTCPYCAPVLSWIKSLFHKLLHMSRLCFVCATRICPSNRTRPNAVIICSSGQSFAVLPLGVKSLRLRTLFGGGHASLTRVETPPLHTRAPNTPRAYSNIKLVRIEFPAKEDLCKFVSGESVVSAEVSCCAVTSVTLLRKAKTSFRPPVLVIYEEAVVSDGK